MKECNGQFIDQQIGFSSKLLGNSRGIMTFQQITAKLFKSRILEISNRLGNWIEDLWRRLLWLELFAYYSLT